MEKFKIGVGLIAAALLVGCSNQTRDEYSEAGHIAGNALNKDLSKGVAAADAAGKAAKRSLKEDEVKGKEESKQLADASMTPKIKSALASADNLHSSGIDVTTVGKTVTLSGSVPTGQEKHRAAVIATSVAGPSYKVVDKIAAGS